MFVILFSMASRTPILIAGAAILLLFALFLGCVRMWELSHKRGIDGRLRLTLADKLFLLAIVALIVVLCV
jgi:hypothetical protein